MDELSQSFEERLREITAYLDLLDALESQVRQGPPQIGEDGATVTVLQQRILYSSVYLQLYNLVESTITKCVDAVSDLVINEEYRPVDLCPELRREWVSLIAKTSMELSYDKRLDSALLLCEHLLQSLPISEFAVSKGGSNWDDVEIYQFSQRLGLSLSISREVSQAIKRPLRDDMGTLKLIKNYRNKLAHGNLSFSECGENVTARELRDMTNSVASYMTEVVGCFVQFMDERIFLAPEVRVRQSRDLD